MDAVLRQPAHEVFFRQAQQFVAPFATVANGECRHRYRRISQIRLDDVVRDQVENLRPRLEQLAVALLKILQPSLQHLRRLVLRIDGQQAVRIREWIAQQRPGFLGQPKHLLGDRNDRLRRCDVERRRAGQRRDERRIQRLDAIEQFGECAQIARERRALRASVFARQIPTRPVDFVFVDRLRCTWGHLRLRLPADAGVG